ncbi:hypothetical protein LTR80_011589 [Exophiala xenobiotica]|nr:hypothetical protein LTR14_011517 [Exophiala xenobiotica]
MQLGYVSERSTITTWHVCAVLGVLLFLRVVWIGLFRVFFHPLARYPGPFITKLSNIPLTIWTAQARSTYARYGVHKEYGNVSQPKIIELIEKFLDITSSSSKPFNIHDYIHNLFLDTTSQLSFGNSFNLLSGHDHPGARDIETYFTISPLFGVFPIAKYLPVGIFRAAREARPRIVASVQNCINDLRDRLRVGTAQHGLLRLKVEAKYGETGTAFSDEELIENAVLFIIAGSGTTATTLIYLMYEVGKRPEI